MSRSPGVAAVGAASALSLLAVFPAAAQTLDARTPEAIAVQTGLEQACLPALESQAHDLPNIPGLDHDDSGAFLPISRQERLTIIPPDHVNPTVCIMSLSYPAGQRQGMLALLNAWSAEHHLKPVKVDELSRGASDQRWTSTWTGQTPHGAMAIAFSTDRSLSAQSGPAGPAQVTVQISLANSAS